MISFSRFDTIYNHDGRTDIQRRQVPSLRIASPHALTRYEPFLRVQTSAKAAITLISIRTKIWTIHNRTPRKFHQIRRQLFELSCWSTTDKQTDVKWNTPSMAEVKTDERNSSLW